MTIISRYPEFGVPLPGILKNIYKNEEKIQEYKLKSFENGYQAGWDDALESFVAKQAKASADLTESLQDMSFTYNEALSKISHALRPMLMQLVSRVLPELARDALLPLIVEYTNQMIASETNFSLSLSAAPVSINLLEKLLEQQDAARFLLSADESMSTGQFYLRINEKERFIDFDTMIIDFRNSLDALYDNALVNQGDGEIMYA